ncbi:sterol desaturase family protein [Pedobacter sp. KLB.chiD]|uniref:sterol desaturase family protein n=1 Tax=Pedobacter sp. KLB.chiD TaxID=3387402 RepID=UPI00399ACF2D
MEKIIETTIEIFSLSAMRYFLIAGIPFCLFYLLWPAKLSKYKIQEKLASKKDFIREILHSMQSTLVFTFIAVVLLLTPIRQYTMIYTNINDYPGWYIPVSVAISLLIHDTYFYWMHVILHHKKLFKFAHLLHHKSTNPSPWTSYSFHLAEGITEGLVLVVIVFILPIHVTGILLFTVVAFAINVYGHLGYEIAPEWFRKSWLFSVFNTSVHHNLHHTRFKGNYGLYFRIWDRLMGTEHPDYVKTYDQLQEKRFGSK